MSVETRINVGTEEEKKIENGKLEMMGINIDISQILGGKIVDQYLAQLKDEDMDKIMNYISSDLFEPTSIFNYETAERVKSLKIKERTKDYYGHYKETEIPIGEIIKNHFNNRIKEELKNKVEEIINSTDYRKKIDDIANELVEYSIIGYKEDMKNRIRERLVGNVLDDTPMYSGASLTDIINLCIEQRLGGRNY